MKICIVGGGTAGLYTAHNLLGMGHRVRLFEPSKLLGKASTHFLPWKPRDSPTLNEVLKNKNFSLEKKKIESLENLGGCDAFVLANGAVPRKPILSGSTCADKVIKWYANGEKRDFNLGKHVCIVGLGDVSLDIVRFLGSPLCQEVEKITVLSRRGPFDSSFSNSQLRNVKDTCQVLPSSCIKQEFERFKNSKVDSQSFESAKRKLEIFKEASPSKLHKVLNLLFHCIPTRIEKSNDRLKLHYSTQDGNKKELVVDSVISSTGYASRDNSGLIKTASKPVFQVGSCVNPKGNLSHIRAEAEAVAGSIDSLLRSK